jgi:Xylose isomerase-like TIM barrel
VATASESVLCPARRELLKCFSVGLGGGLSLRQSPARASQPSFDFPTSARDRLSVTSYPFRAIIDRPTNRGRNPKASTDPAYVDALRAALDRAHSRIVDLGLSGKHFYATDTAVRRDAVLFGKKCVEIAAQVGSPSVRQDVTGHKGENPDVSRAAESLGELAEYSARRNIVINLENDSPEAEDPFFLVAVIEKVNNPYCALCLFLAIRSLETMISTMSVQLRPC